jgi:hypothetical protein
MPMQPPTDPPRDNLVDAQVIQLLQNEEAIVLTGGMEIVDIGLTVIEDISDDLAGGRWNAAATRTCTARRRSRITRQIDWGGDLVRPYLIVSGGTGSGPVQPGRVPPDHARAPPDGVPADVRGGGLRHAAGLNQPVG